MKIRLHCDGCIQRIRKTILKYKGVESVTIDSQKDLVTVTGTMDAGSLVPYLKDKLKRSVDVVASAKKDDGGAGGGEKKEKGGNAGGEKKEKGGGGGGGDGEKKEKGKGDGAGGGDGEKKEKGKGDGGGGDKKKEGGYGEKKKEKEGGGGGGGEKKEAVAATTMEANKMEYYGTYGYGNGNGYGNGYHMEMVHAPQMFSDENPNACSIM
ncbi:heavy metal-associated isoprenylated plant protein 3-like [Iris pallida]|nr:heavy metal-associated isoprenylated plant protein 3-like [Iris pallida]